MNTSPTAIAHCLKTLTFVGIGLTLIGCDAVLDCVDNDGPVFSTDPTLPAAILNQQYLQTIQASVRNEPRDDRFDYDFTIINGALPPGITTESSSGLYTLRGTATELGTYNFEINVFIDDGLDPTSSGLCFRNRSREFELVVQQEGG